MPIPLNIIANEYARQEVDVDILIPECPRDNNPVRDGTGAHLGLRPWYNDMSHDLTDSTLFRILLICIAIDWILHKMDVI